MDKKCPPDLKNKKSAPTEVDARKTQTPIVATQTKQNQGISHNHLAELALLPHIKMIMAKKGYNIPKRQKYL